MSKLLLLKGFNNYYNRIVKTDPESSGSSYKEAVGSGNWWEYADINFYQADGVETTQTINFTATSPAPEGVPDYLVVYDDNGNRKSRWFIMECKHNRKNQFVLNLRRDLFVDFHDEVMASTVYVEKGAVNYSQSSSTQDAALFNSEDFASNEIITGVQWLRPDPRQYAIIFYIAADGKEHRIVDVENGQETVHCIFPRSRTATGNNPYTIYYTVLNNSILSKQFRAAAQITAGLYGSGALYDIQLMPYVPSQALSGDLEYYSGDSPTPTPSGMSDLTLHKAGSVDLQATFSFAPSDFGASFPGSRVAFKTMNQCDKLAICSPGMSAVYEFNPAKIGWWQGSSAWDFDVKITFKPITPYIHVVPKQIGALYGQTINNDPRGLVVQQDYSLPLITDQWKTYEMNNKNYMNSFNREVESVELQNKWGLATDIASAIGGTVSGATMGAALGGGAGAAVAGVGSAIAGTVGVVGNQQLREDALDLRRDQFGYNLENIKALPVLLNRTSSAVIDSQFWPYVLYYTCKSEEKTAFSNKLKYNGMKIMRIGKFETYWHYLGTDVMYMKCKLIRIGIKDDYHVVSEIGKELDKGFYIV